MIYVIHSIENQWPLTSDVTFQKQPESTPSSYDCVEVEGGWLWPQIDCGFKQKSSCVLYLWNMCVHTSESSVWKAYVSGRQWLNDTTYWPNSHSGSCAYLKKNNTRGSPTNRESVVSVRLEDNTLGCMIYVLWSLLWFKIEFCLFFYPTAIIWHVFTSATWKVTPFKNWKFFKPNTDPELLM